MPAPKSEKCYPCFNGCGRKFTRTQGAKNHSAKCNVTPRATADTRYPCLQGCGKTFKTKGWVKTHSRRCNGTQTASDTRYFCKKGCGKSYLDKHNAKKHSSRCNALTGQSYHEKIGSHQVVETESDVDRVVCIKGCRSTFAQKGSMNTHAKRCTGKRCSSREDEFASRRNFETFTTCPKCGLPSSGLNGHLQTSCIMNITSESSARTKKKAELYQRLLKSIGYPHKTLKIYIGDMEDPLSTGLSYRQWFNAYILEIFDPEVTDILDLQSRLRDVTAEETVEKYTSSEWYHPRFTMAKITALDETGSIEENDTSLSAKHQQWETPCHQGLRLPGFPDDDPNDNPDDDIRGVRDHNTATMIRLGITQTIGRSMSSIIDETRPRVFHIDTEFCYTRNGAWQLFEVALVDESRATVLEELIEQHETVANNVMASGMTLERLAEEFTKIIKPTDIIIEWSLSYCDYYIMFKAFDQGDSAVEKNCPRILLIEPLKRVRGVLWGEQARADASRRTGRRNGL
ncbi:hypothetical protein IFR05_000039 [Cadophora sp. M221]|nr:hypothetical protein IFR05_000039 [Cadophora sp. M221]